MCGSYALFRGCGLPPLVFAPFGIQHFVAIPFNGLLYIHGFLLLLASMDLLNVLSGVRLVACGTYHTIAIYSGDSAISQQIDDSAESSQSFALYSRPKLLELPGLGFFPKQAKHLRKSLSSTEFEGYMNSSHFYQLKIGNKLSFEQFLALKKRSDLSFSLS